MKRLLLFCVIFLLLCSCGLSEEDALEETVTLTLVSFGQDRDLTEQVNLFNENHEGYQIEMQIYELDSIESDGRIETLQREIAAGKGPDIINYGGHFASNYCLGHYTENLLDYMPEDWKSIYFSNIVESFFLDGGLYAMPVGFSLETFAGRCDMLGDREKWTVSEMIRIYGEQKEDVILYPGETKTDVFCKIFNGSMEYFIDWEKGECFFNSQEFRDILEFAGSFPDALRITEDYSPKTLFVEGKALLYPVHINEVYNICKAGRILGNSAVSYVGFPVGEGYGTVIQPSSLVLAVSAASEHKDMAWEFISQFLTPDYQSEKLVRCLPLRRDTLKDMLEDAGSMEYAVDADGNRSPIVKSEIRFEGEEPIAIYNVEEGEKEQLLRLIETAHLNGAIDYTLYYVLLEEAQSYFAGDKALEEVADIIQRRAALYVGERATF